MNFITKLLIVSLSFFLPAFVDAQQSPAATQASGPSATGQQPSPPATQAPQRDPQALRLLEESSVKMGATNKAAIVDVQANGQLFASSDPSNPAGSFVAKARGRDFSMEVSRRGQITRYAVLNGRGSELKNGQRRALANYNSEGLSLDILPLFARWTEFEKPDATIQGPATAQVDGMACFEIHVSLSDQSSLNEHGKITVFLDQTSGLVSAIRYSMTLGPRSDSKAPVENRFSDYQSFGAILLPTRITRYINGNPSAVLKINGVRTNNGFTDSDFEN